MKIICAMFGHVFIFDQGIADGWFKPQFQWDDPFFLDAQLTDEERMVRDAASAFAKDVLMPRVIQDFREESFDPAVMREMGQPGCLALPSPKNLVVPVLAMLPMAWRPAKLSG